MAPDLRVGGACKDATGKRFIVARLWESAVQPHEGRPCVGYSDGEGSYQEDWRENWAPDNLRAGDLVKHANYMNRRGLVDSSQQTGIRVHWQDGETSYHPHFQCGCLTLLLPAQES